MTIESIILVLYYIILFLFLTFLFIQLKKSHGARVRVALLKY
jgi:hypothetical protein